MVAEPMLAQLIDFIQNDLYSEFGDPFYTKAQQKRKDVLLFYTSWWY